MINTTLLFNVNMKYSFAVGTNYTRLIREWNCLFPLDYIDTRVISPITIIMSIWLAAVVTFSVSNEARYVAAHRSELDEADTTIDKWSIGVYRSPYCPRPSQTADQRFGNIWSDNILFVLYCTGLDIGPSVIFLGPWCTTTGSINIVLTQWWIRQEGWRFASGRYARKAGMLNPSMLFHDYIRFHASRVNFILLE